jgi:hypothetical protein
LDAFENWIVVGRPRGCVTLFSAFLIQEQVFVEKLGFPQ